MSEHEHEPSRPAAEDPQADQSADPQPDPQWIPVPPPNPYTAQGGASTGRGLAITAMALGLVALLTVAVSAVYFSVFAVLGAAFGVAAIALGIVALVRGQRLRGASITGLGAGAIAVLIAVGVGALAVGALLQPDLGGSGTGTAQGPDADDAPADTPDDAGGSAIEWPANMATGGIIFGADGAIAPSDALEPGTAPQQAEVQRDGVQNDVLIYVDYRCPHCASFEEANGDLLEDALEDGTTTIEVVPLVFLDRASEGSYYSSRAASAMACLADARVAGAWEFHSELLDPSVQPQSGAGPTNEQLIELAEDATDAPLDPTVADCITSERFVPFVQALNDWVFANPVPNAIDAELRVSGTPMAVVNGVPYAGEPSDGAAFRAFFEAQTR